MKNNFRQSGLTLMEIVVAMAVIIIAVVGLVAFRYNSMIDARKAELQLRAGNIAMLVIETWKGRAGDPAFNPATEFSGEITIANSADGLSAPSGFTAISSGTNYVITENGVEYYITLSYKDESDRILSVIVAWPKDYSGTDIESGIYSIEITSSTKII